MIARSSLACCLLLACGGDSHVGPDARPLDAAPDTIGTSVGDPPPGSVALTVTSLGAPVAGVPVYFQNADSSVVLKTKTDARGVAFATLADGGYVTAIGPASTTAATPITTFAMVVAADRLHLDLAPPVVAPLATVALTVPVPTQPGTVTGYDVHDSCGDTLGFGTVQGAPITLPNCANGVIDLLIVPHDDQGNHAFGALFAPGIALADGGSIDVSGTYASFTDLPFSYRNVDSAIAWLNTYRAVLAPTGRVFDTTTGTAAMATVTGSSTIPPVLPATTILTVTEEVPVANELGEQLVYDWRPFATPHDLDVRANRIPALASAPTYDPGKHGVVWMERPAARDANFVRATLHAFRDAIPEGRAWSWQLATAKTGTLATLPVLPDDGFNYNPTATDSVAIDLTTALVPGGYATVRAHAFGDLMTAIAGPMGQLIVETPYSAQL